jgi:hypothetical protein
VYVIWYISRKGNRKTVRVGQAKILRERLADHRDDGQIQDFAKRHTLYVTWAHLGIDQRDGGRGVPRPRAKAQAGRAILRREIGRSQPAILHLTG